jgi:hypothetical protein
MTFKVQGSVQVNGAQAKAELKGVANELKGVASESAKLGAAEQAAAVGSEKMSQSARKAAVEMRAFAKAEAEAAKAAQLGEKAAAKAAAEVERAAARQAAAAERAAAKIVASAERANARTVAGVANITAQFNDIGVMLAAGQNPLQLAIQQGTQISQAFGNVGAAGAVRLLGQGLLSMVSPLNLITIGSIAAGAALFEWLTSAGDDVETLSDQMEDLASSVNAYITSAAAAIQPTDQLAKKYGVLADEADKALKAMAEADRLAAVRQITQKATSLSRTFGGFDGPVEGLIGSQAEETLRTLRRELKLTGEDSVTVSRHLEALGRAKGPEEVVRSANAARDALLAAGVVADQDLVRALAQVAEEAAHMNKSVRDSNFAEQINTSFAAARIEMMRMRAESDAALVSSNERIALLQQEAGVRNLIALFGRDSEVVTQNILAAERSIYEAQLQNMNLAASRVQEELNAWDAAKGFNAEAAGMQGFLSAAATAAGGIATNIWNAVAAFAALKAQEANAKRIASFGGDERGSQRDGRMSAAQFQADSAKATANRRASKLRAEALGTGKRSGGGAKAATDEADAVQDLIEQLRDEIALERELDPVKREVIKHRDVLSKATAGERAEVERLIVQREREKAATEALTYVSDQSGDALVDALMGAGDAGERLIDTLKRAVLQAALLGKGPLSGLFGGGLFGGGLFGGGLFSGPSTGTLGLPFAEGGMIFGEGDGTADKIPVWASAGEFIVNAKSTKRNRQLLERINAAPAFATGGIVGGAPTGGAAARASGTLEQHIHINGATGNSEIRDMVAQGVRLGIELHDREVLPTRVQDILAHRRVTGK